MQIKPDEILRAPYSRVLIPEADGTFSAEILEFPGCFAQGKSPNEAFNNLEKAAKVWIEATLAQGLNIPSPALNQSYSGRIALRIPRSLHKRAAQMAARDATSLNQFLITAIASRIGAEEYHTHLCNNFEKLLSCTISNTISVRSTAQIFMNAPSSTLYIKNAAGGNNATVTAQTKEPFCRLLDPWFTNKNNAISDNRINISGLIPQDTNTGR